MTRRILCLAAILMAAVTSVMAQRAMEKLDRGLIAVKTENGVYCSWRIFGEEYYDVKYNLYRGTTKVNSEPLNVSNFTDAHGTASSQYTVKAVVRGVEQSASAAATVWAQNYLEITPTHENLKSVYVPNDACCADVDGDGVVEILMKFDNQSEISQSFPKNGPNINGVDTKEYSLFECLKLDGTRLWYVNCGPNMGDFQNNEQNIVAYDWDGDGKAEALFRAADGTTITDKFGQTHVIGDVSKNYRAATGGGSNWFMHDGAEYLVYINGETGVPYQIMEYPLKRLESGETNLEAAWGDGYGHRSTKHFFGAPYLDGRKPSIFLARGIYTRHKMVALDVNPTTHELTERWRWTCNTPGSPWYGNGYHNYTVADVDWDGRDEIVFGSMVIDDNGQGLSTTGFGHGDAHHVSDLDPYIHGSEIFACMEDNPGTNYRDATTSKVYYRYYGAKDVGRCMAGNFSNDFPGAMGTPTNIGPISLVTANTVSGITTTGVTENFRIYWDGDLLEETQNYVNGKNTAVGIYKYGKGEIDRLTGSLTNNDTKGTPCYQGDIFGDWREEVITRTADNKIRIFTTTIPTEWRNYTLWHDMQYRNAMVWQMCGYNQPPHASYFLGELEGITMAPPAVTMTDRTEVKNNGTIGSSLDDQQVLLAETGDMTVSVSDGAEPYIFFDNAPSWVQGHDDNSNITYQYFTHTLTGGAFTGSMRLVKQGDGTLILPNVTETYTGNTDVWAGTLKFDGTMQKSPVWLNRHTSLESAGTFNAGIKADYNATIYPGGKTTTGSLTTTTLALGFGSRVVFDLNNDLTADQLNATTLTIEKKDWQYGPEYNAPVFQIVPHFATGLKDLPAGKYLIATIGNVVGNLSDIKLEGLDRQKAALSYEEGKIYLEIFPLRDASSVKWNGGMDAIWDLGTSANFMKGDENDIFVVGDAVTFNDDATQTTVNLKGKLSPASIVFANNSKDLTLSGQGSLIGEAPVTMQGSGTVTINTRNTLTGGITIKSGKVIPATLAATDGVEFGALGAVSNVIHMDGGTLGITSDLATSQTISLQQDGGTIDVASNRIFRQNGSIRRKDATVHGVLYKTGYGTMNLSPNNTFGTLYINQGSVNLQEKNDVINAAETIVFNGENTTVVDPNNSYTFSTNNINYRVNEGATGKLYLDGRCDYKGSLSGSGELTVYANYVRNKLQGDWSAFEGTLIANHAADNYEFTWDNNYGLPNATLNIANGTTFTCNKSSLRIGSLAGAGTLAMTANGTTNLYVGSDNRDMTFKGSISGKVNVTKTGTGAWTFTNATDVNEYFFQGGDIILNNKNLKTSFFGTAIANVQYDACLKGMGTVGSVRVMEGGTVEPGQVTSERHYGAITSTGFMYFYEGTKLNLNIFKMLNNNNGRSYLEVKGKLELNGEINIGIGTPSEPYVPAVGDSFIMWKCGSISGTPTIKLAELPEGFAWDTTDLLTTTGTIRVVAATGIQNVKALNRYDGLYYTIDGRSVNKPTQKGLYIQNGKKIVIK